MTIEDALDSAVAGAPRGEVTFPADFNGFPGTVHGGAVAALLHQLTLPRAPVRLRLDLFRGVPTETPLRLVTGSGGAKARQARLSLWQGDRHLAEAAFSREASGLEPDQVSLGAAALGRPEGETPRTRSCLACGTDNPLGLGLRLQVNERYVWKHFEPGDAYRTRKGSVHPTLATVALDELGWWLGALGQGECGVTTEVAVTLWGPVPFTPLLLVGDRAAVRPDDDPRGRYCRAAVGLFTAEGEPVATGEVRFAASRAYTRRLLGPFLDTTSLDELARFFPSVTAVDRHPP